MLESLLAFGFHLNYIDSDQYTLLSFEEKNVVVNIIPVDHNCEAAGLISLQEYYNAKGIYLVHLWEDVWKTKRTQVIGRIASLLGLNKRIHGRKTRVIKITQKEADDFLDLHHLQGSAKSKYRFALQTEDDLVAVICFSNLRYMKKGGPEYRSAELIRFASLTGSTVAGGFTKLLRHFTALYKPDDVMSYADRDWSLGKAYEQAGFVLSEVTPPAELWLDLVTLKRYFTHRLPQNAFGGVEDRKYVRIFNTGNLKYILYSHSANTSS